MKPTRTILLLAAVISAAMLTSCKKSDQKKEATNLLTTSPWKFASLEWRTTSGAWVAPPSWGSVPDYPLSMTLLDNNTYTTGTSTGSYGTWQLSADKSQLIMFTKSGSSITATIATLTATSLQLTTPMDPTKTYTVEGSGAGAKYTYYDTERTTFTH